MARDTVNNSIVIENANIGFLNFSGKEGKHNAEGSRNFVIFLETDLAHMLQEDGWNVRWLNPRDPDDDPQGILQVKVAFGKYPPKIVLIKNGKKSELNEETVNILDWVDREMVDIVIRPYHYSVNGREGIKAYLKTLYCVLTTDLLADKYENTPDAATDVIGGCGECETCLGECEEGKIL